MRRENNKAKDRMSSILNVEPEDSINMLEDGSRFDQKCPSGQTMRKA